MANIVITITDVKMITTYNDQSASNKGRLVKNTNRRCISETDVDADTDEVEVTLRTGKSFHLDFSLVDSINGVTPTSKTDLADKISDLIL